MPIFRMSDPRGEALQQFGQALGYGVGKGLSGKTLKSMFQDVLDAGGSPLTAMQKILPYDSDLAEKLGNTEMKKRGQETIKKILSRYMPEVAGMIREGDDPLVAFQAAVDWDEMTSRQSQRDIAERKQRLDEWTAQEEAAQAGLTEEERDKGIVQQVGDRMHLINPYTGALIRDLGVAPPKSTGDRIPVSEKVQMDLLNEYQANLSKIASIKAGENIWIPEKKTRGEAIRMLEERNKQIARRYPQVGGDIKTLGMFGDAKPTMGKAPDELYQAFPPEKNKGVVKRDNETGIEYISDGKEWLPR